ncbi:hypothetical protein [Parasediminibacterium sp. JCM 36343]|uniref:hypothetical protein n=1 Tax=Parasediminibacterium sp. JCM 36343 TaxID=3374279 RepID=UPI0039784F97
MIGSLKNIRLGLILLLVASSFLGHSQENSPWKKLTEHDNTVSSVFVGLGRHEYSLTGGQGFAVYLKNYNIEPVLVTGTVVATTICGNEITTNFSTTLAPDQESSGGDFSNTANSQTGVVLPTDCIGRKTYKGKKAFVNRIKDVTIRNFNVKPLGLVAKPLSPLATQKLEEAKQIVFIKQKTQDSLLYVIDTLKKKKLALQEGYDKLSLENNNLLLAAQKDSLTKKMAKLKKDTLKYGYASNTLYTSPYFGIGWDNLPIFINEDVVNKTSATGASSHPVLAAGVVLSVLNHSAISIKLNAFGSHGANIATKTLGSHLEIGGLLTILGGAHYYSHLKAFAEGGIIYREGNWKKDVEVKNTASPATTLPATQSADYEYNVLRFGGGLQYQWNKGESHIKPGIFWDKPSITNGSTVMLEQLEFQLCDKLKIIGTYGSDYFVGGKNSFVIANKEKQDYFSIRMLISCRTFVAHL